MATEENGIHLVGSAAHLLLYRDDKILVIRRANVDYLPGFWSVPAGHVERGETAVEACVRETREEVALELTTNQLKFALVQQKGDEDGEARIDFFFEAHWTPGMRPRAADPNEVADLGWVPAAELPEPFAPYVRAALQARARSERLSFWGLG